MGTGNLTSTVISGIDEVETYIKLVLSKVLNMMIIPILLLIAIAFWIYKQRLCWRLLFLLP